MTRSGGRAHLVARRRDGAQLAAGCWWSSSGCSPVGPTSRCSACRSSWSRRGAADRRLRGPAPLRASSRAPTRGGARRAGPAPPGRLGEAAPVARGHRHARSSSPRVGRSGAGALGAHRAAGAARGRRPGHRGRRGGDEHDHPGAGRVVAVPPRPRRVAAVPVPRRLRGHPGQHESRRPGDGGGLRDLNLFPAGDSLRRVDWRVTARHSPDLDQLWVRRTYALAEAHVVVVVDSRDDVGPDPRTWSGRGPSAPTTRPRWTSPGRRPTPHQRYLAAGDRVGVEDLGALRQPDAPGRGAAARRPRAQLARAAAPGGEPRRWCARRGCQCRARGGGLDLPRRRGRRPRAAVAPDGAPRARRRRAAAAARAHLEPRERIALRVVHLERADRLAALDAADVELLRWADPGADAALRRLARRRRR